MFSGVLNLSVMPAYSDASSLFLAASNIRA